LTHFSYGGLRDEKRSANVEADHVVEMSFGDIDEGFGNIHSRVIQQDIQAFKAGEGGAHLLSPHNIANDYARAASGVNNAFGDLLQFATRPAE
jgi:hypothetical protein